MNDPLFGNKLAAAILAALLLFFGLPQLASALLGGGHHGGGHGDELHLAYPIEFQTGGAAVKEVVVVDLGTLMASADPAVGKRRSGACASCHTFEQGGAQKTGPNLWNIVGRQVAAVGGFNYTSALQGAGGEWTYERLDEYLKNSQSYIPGTAMVQKIRKDEQRAQILAYLSTLSDAPVAFPAPAAPAAEEAVEEAAAEHAEGAH